MVGRVLRGLRNELRVRRERLANERRMRAFYGQFVRPGDLCFDVGANHGSRTHAFLRLGARVVAVEPQEACLRDLRQRFGRDRRVVLEPVALGEKPGKAELRLAAESGLASLSSEWIDKVRGSGRFADQSWDERQAVEVTTMDALIQRHGRPRFTKVDVEGFEPAVFAGLHQPLPFVSFEFASEALDGTVACMRRLASLGTTEFNFSLGESMVLESHEWLAWNVVERRLRSLEGSLPWGDVYGRMPGH